MHKLTQRLDEVMDTLYGTRGFDMDYFYNEHGELLEVLFKAVKRGDTRREEMEQLQELHDALDDFVKFSSEYNSELGDF